MQRLSVLLLFGKISELEYPTVHKFFLVPHINRHDLLRFSP